MHKRSYKERILVPIDGSEDISFYTKGGLLLAKGYVRVVIGGRGPYIEFLDTQIIKDNIYVPKHAEYKLQRMMPYYWEYRSKDKCFVKLYYQKMLVQYADYKIDYWYISPFDLKTDKLENLVLPLYADPEEIIEEISPSTDISKGSLFQDL